MEKPKFADGWEKNLKRLSGWACVAFAARCAQRVLPLYSDYEKSFQLNSSPVRIQKIQNAIAIILEAAETAGTSTSLKNEEFSTSTAAILSARTIDNPKTGTIEPASVQYYSHAAAHQAIQVAYAAVETIKHVYAAHASEAHSKAFAAKLKNLHSINEMFDEARQKRGEEAENELIEALRQLNTEGGKIYFDPDNLKYLLKSGKESKS